jgi:hypothetical protein
MSTNNSLWEEQEGKEEPTDGDSPIPKKDIKHDKILHNDYNSGNIEFEELGIPRVDSDYVDVYMGNYYNAADYHAQMNLMEMVDQSFKASEYSKVIGAKRKIPKQLFGKIYVAIHQDFEKGDVTEIEIFTTVAEYFGLSYEAFYENIPAMYRENLVKELDDKFGALKKKGMRRLF